MDTNIHGMDSPRIDPLAGDSAARLANSIRQTPRAEPGDARQSEPSPQPTDVRAPERESRSENSPRDAADRRDALDLSAKNDKARELAIEYLREVIDPDPIDGKTEVEARAAQAARKPAAEPAPAQRPWFKPDRGSLDIVA